MIAIVAVLLALPALETQTMPVSAPVGATRIARWKGDRQAAFTMYFDDGLPSHLNNAIPALIKRGLVGTFYLNPAARWYQATREKWEKEIPATDMQYAAHTMTHSGGNSYEQIEAEIAGSAEYVRRINPVSRTSPLLSYCKPGGVKPERWPITEDQHAELLRKYNLVHRPGSIPDAAGREVNTADEMFALVEGALARGDMGYITFHGVGGDWISADLDAFNAFLDRLAAATDRVWVDGHITLHKYAAERDSAKVQVLRADVERIRLRLTSEADPELYDQPLTLVTAVPEEWAGRKCNVDQGRRRRVVVPQDGYLQYEALPNGEEIVIQSDPAVIKPVPPERVAAIAAMLTPEPIKLVPSIDDRQAWEALAATDRGQDIVRRAREYLTQPPVDLSDEVYLAFTREGNRAVWDHAIHRARGRMDALVLAECLTNSGEFLEAAKAELRSVCREKTWVMSAHDKDLVNFRGEAVEIDLMVAMTAWELATAADLLGDRLDAEMREMIYREIDRRVWVPMEQTLTGETKAAWWLTTTNNWNAVCLAGVVCSSLTFEPSVQRRAEMLAAADKYVAYFLEGFAEDGYCTEGIGYWNYGFSSFLLLSDVAYRATDGKIDLLADERAQRAALFPQRLRMADRTYPAFADCRVNQGAVGRYMNYIAARLNGSGPVTSGLSWRLYEIAVLAFPNASAHPTEVLVDAADASQPLRGWFPHAGVLTCRPSEPGEEKLSVALKGGHNGEHHNHNDVGTFVVAVGSTCVLLDPGGEVYTSRTFSDRRYESKLLNSFGHPVPVVAGRLQRPGGDAAARVLSRNFTDEVDELVLDLAAAYEAPELKSLTRTFRYSREGNGSLTVIDEVSYAGAATFETALVTFGQWTRDEEGLTVSVDDKSVRVTIDTAGAAYEIAAETIEEDRHGEGKPTRLGIRLTEPTSDARMTLTITSQGN